MQLIQNITTEFNDKVQTATLSLTEWFGADVPVDWASAVSALEGAKMSIEMEVTSIHQEVHSLVWSKEQIQDNKEATDMKTN